MQASRNAVIAPAWLQEESARIVGPGHRPPRLLVSSRLSTAAALGVRRPAILLPFVLTQDGPTTALRAVLAHEWAHIRNGDLWLLALVRWLFVLLFAHPLFWWLRRAIRGDQELLADAAAAGDNRPAYAEELLRLIRTIAHPSPISVSVGIWESSSQLSRRISVLLDENFCVEPRASRPWRYQALGLLLLLGLAGSLVTLQPRRSAGEEGLAKHVVETAADCMRRGRASAEKGEYDKAIAAYTQALAVANPSEPKGKKVIAAAYHSRGYAWRKKDEYDKAIADFTEALAINPRDAYAYDSRGAAWDDKGEHDKAIADFNQALAIDPTYAIAYDNRGCAWDEKGEYEKAIATMKALKIDPQNHRAYIHLARFTLRVQTRNTVTERRRWKTQTKPII